MQKSYCILTEGLSFSFDNVSILENVSFEVEYGQKVALTGNSGTGKSSVLNILAGFNINYSGEIKIFDKILNEKSISEIRQNMAWLPQETNINYNTVRELLLAPFDFKLNKKNRPTDKEIKSILDDFLLSSKILKKSTLEISGGQKQRILLASALLLKKKLIILDEPGSALDEDSRNAVLDRILSEDTTILFSTHDKSWIEKSDIEINLSKKNYNE